MQTNEFHQPVGDPVDGWTPRPAPGGVPLEGRFVVLQPWTDEHLGELFASTCDPAHDQLWTYMSGGPFRDEADLAAYLTRSTGLGRTAPYAFVVDGVVHGFGQLLNVRPEIGVAEVGSLTYGPALQRSAAATEAQLLLAEHVFGLGYRRYEWKCDSLNEPSRRAARRLGFTYEGCFRQALVYKGRSRDTDWFAMTDGDWQRLRPAYRRWLDGVDGAGVQRESLGDLTRAALAAR